MPQRKVVFATNEIYHIFNRSVAREHIFASKIELRRLLEIIEYYYLPQTLRFSKFKTLPEKIKRDYILLNTKKTPLVEIYAFAFMPNHYHFLIKQIQDGGIVRFISNIQNSFAKYFNLKNDRDGSLFLNPFKAKRVETDEQFIHVSRYIHLNPVTSYIIEFDKLDKYLWTSYCNYVNNTNLPFLNTKNILEMFKSKRDYSQFAANQVDYQRHLHLIKDQIIE